jgi:hypothetical protein
MNFDLHTSESRPIAIHLSSKNINVHASGTRYRSSTSESAFCFAFAGSNARYKIQG